MRSTNRGFAFMVLLVVLGIIVCVGDLRADEIKLWSIDKYQNIVRTQSPDESTRPVPVLRIAMAQNEFRDAVFMIGPAERDMRLNVRVAVDGNLPDGFIETLETIYIKNREGGETGDAIRPLNGALVVPKGQSRQIYLRANTRTNAVSAGVYPFKVKLHDVDSNASRTLAGRVEVWDFALPPHDILPNQSWVQFEDSDFAGGELNAAAVRDMKKFGINVLFIHGRESPRPTSIGSDGTVASFDDSMLRARIEPVLKVWREQPGSERLRIIVTLAGMYDFGCPDVPGMSRMEEKWKIVFAQWLRQLRTSMTNMGIDRNDWLLTFADETPYKDILSTEVPVAEFARSVEPGIQLLTDTSLNNDPVAITSIIVNPAEADRLFKTFDVFQPNLRYVFLYDADETNGWYASQVRKHNKELWTYQCRTDLGVVRTGPVNNPYYDENNLYSYYRVSAWNMLKYGIAGTGMWTYCAQVNNWREGTCLLVYKIDDQLVHSRRFEMYREGLDDYRYVWLLRKLAREQGAAAEAKAEKLIANAVADITTDARDVSRCETWRARIADEILKLKPEPD